MLRYRALHPGCKGSIRTSGIYIYTYVYICVYIYIYVYGSGIKV